MKDIPMIVDRTKFLIGVGLLAGFTVVLVVMFMPIFDGQNALNYMDALYNSISKGSAYYIPDLREEAAGLDGTTAELSLGFDSEEKSELAAVLLSRAGADVVPSGAKLNVRADLGRVLTVVLQDSDNLFQNDDESFEAGYGRSGKDALFGWWVTLKAMDRDLTRQKRFAEAAFVTTVKKKAVECAYNYRGIVPRNIADNIGVVLLSLVFYVIYTVWYGYAIMLIFEGCGLKTAH
jgi:hypothetical protein